MIHTKLIQDGFRSQFFVNHSDQIEWDHLAHLQFAQIRTLDATFYHIWAGFADGSFIGYYDKGVGPNPEAKKSQYSVSYQAGWNYSCPEYNFTYDD